MTVAALSASALAGPATAARPSFPLSFVGIYKNGTPVKVKKFQFAGAPVQCAQGLTSYSTPKPLPAMKVKNREFSGTFENKGTKVRVTGKYKRNLQKVTGTLKVTGKVGSYTDCASGKMTWKTN
jgi:hypothetical protein